MAQAVRPLHTREAAAGQRMSLAGAVGDRHRVLSQGSGMKGSLFNRDEAMKMAGGGEEDEVLRFFTAIRITAIQTGCHLPCTPSHP